MARSADLRVNPRGRHRPPLHAYGLAHFPVDLAILLPDEDLGGNAGVAGVAVGLLWSKRTRLAARAEPVSH